MRGRRRNVGLWSEAPTYRTGGDRGPARRRPPPQGGPCRGRGL